MTTPFPTTVIGGRNYKLHRLDPLTGGRIATRVAQILAPALGDGDMLRELVGKFSEKEKADTEGQAAATPGILENTRLLEALAGGVAKVDGEALYDLAQKCVAGRLFNDNGKLHDDHAFNQHFSEFPRDLLPVLVWALKENVSGFFGFGAKG